MIFCHFLTNIIFSNFVEVIISSEYLISGLFTIFTNTSLLVFILSHNRLKQCKNAIVCSTLIAGIMFACCYILPRFAIMFTNGLQIWPRDYRCGILSRIGQAIFFSLNVHLMIRILEIYTQVCYPFKASRILTTRNITIFLFLVWCTTLSIPIGFQIYFEIGYASKMLSVVTCSQISLKLLTILSILLAIFSLIVLTFSTVAYIRVLYITNHAIQRIRHISHSISVELNRGTKYEKRAKGIRQALILLLVYLLSMTPFLILVIYTQLYYNGQVKRPWSEELVTAFRLFQYIAFLFPAFQPLLLASFTADIREELLKYYNHRMKSQGDLAINYRIQ